jgi:hypothetical protein
MNSRILRWTISGAILLVMVFTIHSSCVTAAEANSYVLQEEPKDAQAVKAVRQKGKEGERVVVVGRIGGRANPWIKGAAAFSIVDSSLRSCDQIPGDNCPTPWDYCCESDLGKATLLITFVDDAGKLVKHDSRELLSVKELQTVVVEGKVKRDKANNVSILASKIYVKK